MVSALTILHDRWLTIGHMQSGTGERRTDSWSDRQQLVQTSAAGPIARGQTDQQQLVGAAARAAEGSAVPFPFKLLPLDAETQRRVIADFPGYPNGLQCVQSWGFKVVGTATETDLEALYNRPLQPGDIWVCSPPKCGSMWTQELVWLLENDLDFDGCRVMLTERWRFSESCMAIDLEQRTQLAAKRTAPAASAGRSRFVKSHLPMSLCPPRLLDVCKVVYVARNPKDICVSFYKHARRYKNVNFQKELEVFADHFLAGNVVLTPVVPHMIEAWNLRHHPNMCFLFYEDMKRDLRGQIRRLAGFLGRQYSDAQVDRLAEYLHIDAFKKNPWRSQDFGKGAGMMNEGEGDFIRTGKAGDWKNHMSAEMSARFDRLLEEQLKGTDLRFTMELQQQD
ncbi:sulfotransferase 1C4-like [Pollicipes pollicipes]|uniref:sulfotransferase 1C4-like n=1 Tax=Pollicipes pollicipes TaxID=41117 RepID=UPI001884A126|nr:sulfotransferase 1C4-like [Pollicipes pollicipes]